MTTIRKMIVLCGLAALLAVTTFSPVARADELRPQEKTALEGNKGGRGKGRGGRGRDGGRHRRSGGGSGWAWAGFGAAVGLGVLSAVTSNNSNSYVYVEPEPSYQVVYPSTTYYYYPAPSYPAGTYVQPNYVQPNYGQTYVVPAQPSVPCNTCP